MWKMVRQAPLFLACACSCFGLAGATLLNQTTEESTSVTADIRALCGIPPNFEYGADSMKPKGIKDSVYFEKRDEQEELDPFAGPVEILHTRLSFLERAAKCLLNASDSHPHIKKNEIPQVKQYFEQILIERWSKDLPESAETKGLDNLIANIFTVLQPVYEKPGLREKMTEFDMAQLETEIPLFEKRIDDFRSVLVHHLYTKSQQYRDADLHDLKTQLKDAVLEFHSKNYPSTVQKCALDILIETTLELSDWMAHEYTPNQPHYYSKTQGVLASRFNERLSAINATLHTISSAEDFEVYFRLVARAQSHASEFVCLNFPENKFTRKNTKLFKEIFAKIKQLELSNGDKAYFVTFDSIKASSMRQKLNAVKKHLSDLDPVTGLPPSAYWKLLQVKIDLKNWASQISSWREILSTTEIKELHSLCKEGITEVNRLKRAFDKHVPPETA